VAAGSRSRSRRSRRWPTRASCASTNAASRSRRAAGCWCARSRWPSIAISPGLPAAPRTRASPDPGGALAFASSTPRSFPREPSMPRIPYVPADLTEPRAIVAAVRARRGGTLLNLDRMLLHSPEMAAGWNAYLGAIRTQLLLSPKLRELAMCVVAVLNRADYEFGHHAPEF